MAKPKPEHRWEWPEEAARQSDWITVEELRALAGKKTAERGDQFGCIIYYSDGAHQRSALAPSVRIVVASPYSPSVRIVVASPHE